MKASSNIRALLTSALILSGCEVSTESSDEPIDVGQNTPPPAELSVSLYASDRFSQHTDTFLQGESIQLHMTAVNTGSETVHITGVSGCLMNIEIFNESDQSVGHIPLICVALAPSLIPIHPGQFVNESLTWDQATTSTNVLPIGTYTVTGRLGNDSGKASLTLNIL